MQGHLPQNMAIAGASIVKLQLLWFYSGCHWKHSKSLPHSLTFIPVMALLWIRSMQTRSLCRGNYYFFLCRKKDPTTTKSSLKGG